MNGRIGKTIIGVFVLGAAVAWAGGSVNIVYPNSIKHPVTDTYHGVSVTEDYRWLEENSDQVKAWDARQLGQTRLFLDSRPNRMVWQQRLQQLYDDTPIRYRAGVQRGAFFALKRVPRTNQPILVMMPTAGDVKKEKVILDPNQLNAKGTTAIDFFEPSIDGKYVAVSLSDNGSEDGTVHIFESKTGKKLADVVPRVQYPTGGGSVAWKADGSGFYYTRYPQGDERAPEDRNFYQQIYFHQLGTPASADVYVLGKDFPRIAETALSTTRDGRYVLASVANGDGGEYAFYLLDTASKESTWKKLADHADKVRRMEFGVDGRLYALSLNKTPRGQILVMPLNQPDLAQAKVLVAESDLVIEQMLPTRSRLYVAYLAGGPSQVRVFGLDGKRLADLPAEPVSALYLGEHLGGDEILLGSESYKKPFAWYRYNPTSGKLAPTALSGKYRFNFDDAVVVREMAKSKDGTLVPINILMKKGTKLDGNNPVLLTGYGGYSISLSPRFSVANRAWLDHGGIFVEANLRGGGEFGEAWHRAGNLLNKQNVFDDFIGAAEHLIARGYTRKERLAIEGGSNGGLLMGAVLTQRPDLFRAVVSHVGIYDMLRVELTPNGAFNVTEFGSVKDEAQFKALYAYSPYHRVVDGTTYPGVLLTTGVNDGRVDAWQSRKMTARLQYAAAPGRPILLRISGDTGHGIGTGISTRILEQTDTLTFLADQLDMQ